MVKLNECPRDAMQGIQEFIPTALKVEYINAILKVGFDLIDFGSFVSPKAIPQLKDSASVLSKLDLSSTSSKLLAIVANQRGAENASEYEQIDLLGFPFSVSEQFQLRNTKSTRKQSLNTIQRLLDITHQSNKKLRVYLSMGFGNPYNEEYSPQIVLDWAGELVKLGVEELALSDTIGSSHPKNITPLFDLMINALPTTEISAHFHSSPHTWKEKVASAFQAGCQSFDAAIGGRGGCPMATDQLTGNLAMENLVEFFQKETKIEINNNALNEAMDLSAKVFNTYF